MQDRDEPPAEARRRTTVLELDVVPVLSPAMALARVPVLGRIAVRHEGPAVVGAVLHVELQDVEGLVGPPWERVLDLEPGGTAVVADPGLLLDPDAAGQIPERRAARVVAQLISDQGLLAERTVQTVLLAAREWLAVPRPLALEVLPAFVDPSDPALVRLIPSAGPEAGDGRDVPGWPARDEDPSARAQDPTVRAENPTVRADRLAGAVLEAVRSLGPALLPGAALATEGQTVRSPGRTIADRAGTSLDLAVLLASAAERAGLRPLLLAVQDGALVAYWRRPLAFAAPALTSGDRLLALAEEGAVGVLDLDGVSAQDGLARLRRTAGTALGVVDVAVARRAGIRPLPAEPVASGDVDPADQSVEPGDDPSQTAVRAADRDGAPPVPDPAGALEEPAPDLDLPVLAPPALDEAVRPASAVRPDLAARGGDPAARDHWAELLGPRDRRDRLQDLPDADTVPLTPPTTSLGVFQAAVEGGRRLRLAAADDLGDVAGVAHDATSAAGLPAEVLREAFQGLSTVFTAVPPADHPARLAELARRGRTLAEEAGARGLHLVLGSLIRPDGDGETRMPLVLLPVRLSREGAAGHVLEVAGHGEGLVNPGLRAWLEGLPPSTRPSPGGGRVDADAVVRSVREALEATGAAGRVDPAPLLAVLRPGVHDLRRDLLDGWPELAAQPLVHHLSGPAGLPFLDPVDGGDQDPDELAGLVPLPADSGQLTVVAQAAAGRTLVVDAPPGTGPDTMLADLLAHAAAEGSAVLVVSRTAAALDALRDRLDAVGLGPICLDLHGDAARPDALRARIRAALDLVEPDGVRDPARDQDVLRGVRQSLARYVERLHAPNGAGLSFYSARTTLLGLGDHGPALPVPAELLADGAKASLDTARRLLESFVEVAEVVRPGPAHPWGFVGLADPSRIDAAAVARVVAEVDEAFAGFAAMEQTRRPGTVSDPLLAARTPDDLATLAVFVAAVASGRAAEEPGREPALPAAQGFGRAAGRRLELLDATRADPWRRQAAAALDRVAAFAAAEHPALEQAVPEVLTLPLADLARRAEEAAHSGLLGRGARVAEVLAELRPGLRPDAEVRPRRLPDLLAALLALQDEVTALAVEVEAVPGLFLPADWNPLLPGGLETVRQQVAWLSWAGQAVEPDGPDAARDRFVHALRTYLDAARQGISDRGVQTLRRAAAAAGELLRTFSSADDQLARWAGEDGLIAQWLATSEAREAELTVASEGGAAGTPGAASTPGAARTADATASSGSAGSPAPGGLRGWTVLNGVVEPLRRLGLDRAVEALLRGTIEPRDVLHAFERGVAVASARERRSATGLDAFNAEAHERGLRRFEQVLAQMRQEAPARVLREVVRRRDALLAADPQGAERLTALREELARHRDGTDVRALIDGYGDIVLRALPLVLAAPEDVARCLPVRSGLVDLVVLHEASRLPLAEAVGAMGRGRSVVVVGDGRQPPPADPTIEEDGVPVPEGCVRWVDPEGGDVLSACRRAGVPELRLGWHHRSRDESLIAFANGVHHGGRLRSVPAPPGLDGTTGVRLVRVAAPSRKAEAQAVADEVLRRLGSAGEGAFPSIGVVALHRDQRDLIEAALREGGDERVLRALESPRASDALVVTTVEEAQADERDTILLSLGIDPVDGGRAPGGAPGALPHGRLLAADGDRWLHAAVTRARQRVLVFSRVEPGDLRPQDSVSAGLRQLRAYLDLAADDAPARTWAMAAPGEWARIPDRHRDQVAEGLAGRGLTVLTDVGVSGFRVDLAVAPASAPDRPVLAVLLDGPAWAAAPTVGDREGLPGQALERAGWGGVARVWLPAWLATPGQVLDQLEAAVEEAVQVVAEREFLADRHAVAARRGAGREAPADREAAADRRDGTDRGDGTDRRVDAEPAETAAPTEAVRGSGPSGDGPSTGADPVERTGLSERAGLSEGTGLSDASDLASGTGAEPSAPRYRLAEDVVPGPVGTYRPWEVLAAGGRDVLDALPQDDAIARVQAVVEQVVDAEGPVQAGRLARLVGSAFGLSRVLVTRAEAILRQVPDGLAVVVERPVPGEEPGDEREEVFVWPRGTDPGTWTAFRHGDPVRTRSAEEVSLREIANAMVGVLAARGELGEDDLLRDVLTVVDAVPAEPVPASWRSRAEAALQEAVDQGRILRRPGGSGEV